MTKKYVGSVGLAIYVNVGQDLTSATKTEIHVQKPDGTSAIWTARVAVQDESGRFLSPTDGILTYTTKVGDFQYLASTGSRHMLSGTKHRNITAKRQYSRCIPNMADAYVQCNGHLRPATDSCCWECIRKWKKSYLEEIAKKNGGCSLAASEKV